MPKKGLSDDQMTKLIKEVHRRPYLWDPDHEDYNDKYHLSRSWEDISEEMKISDKILRRKWKNLRDAFRKESKKVKPSAWKYYNMLTFLKFRNNNDENDNEEDNEIDGDEDTSEAEVTENYLKFEPPDSNEEVYLNEEDPIPEKRRRENEEDYDVMFLKSLAPYFKQLDPIRKLVVRSKMQDIMLNEIAAQTSSNKLNNSKR